MGIGRDDDDYVGDVSLFLSLFCRGKSLPLLWLTYPDPGGQALYVKD